VKVSSLEDLALLPEPMALQRHFDARNFRLFRLLLGAIALASLVGLGLSLGGTIGPLRVSFYGFSLFSALAAAMLHREAFFAKYFRHILTGYLFIQLACTPLWSMRLSEGTLIEIGPILPFLLVFFRLRLVEHLLLFGSFWVAEMFSPLIGLTPAGVTGAQATAEQHWNAVLTVTLGTLICFAAAAILTQVDRRRFLEVWRREQSRSRERQRIRDEIEYARKIQLSMLPKGSPDFDWLDFSSASLPATEVGGDYYDYFTVSPTRLALVMADVAGHGIASGLLLSGVRSCLYMVEEELGTPTAVFERLNRMVRRTGARRTYVTMVLAVLEAPGGKLVLTSAGHPPVLHWSAARQVITPVGKGALPLGTGLEARFEQEELLVGSGDILLMYTDGLIESRNGREEDYGEDRLRRVLTRASGSRSAREIRDSILSDLANFKGNVEQADDITLVVARLK
jgi:serine phosphatase RsbU (regulator of sigma subunit)